MDPREAAWRRAAQAALALVGDGMVLGLGSGRTAAMFVRALGERVRAGLDVRGVATSRVTERIAIESGVPLLSPGELPSVDLAIDGADEVDGELHLTKGGGGCLLREKIIASAADEMIVICDREKMVTTLGAFPLPVGVTPFAWNHTARKVAACLSDLTGRPVVPVLRLQNGAPMVTDDGNYILDCPCGRIDAPARVGQALDLLPGVVGNGLFAGMCARVICADFSGGVDIIRRR